MKFAGFEFAEIEDAIGQLLGLEAGVRAQVLALVAAIDRDAEPWRRDGAPSLPAWLATRFGLSIHSARELVAVAEQLGELPAIAGAFAAGRLSWDQLRWVARVADATTDERWAADAPGLAPAQLERLARSRERISRERETELRRQRSLRWWTSGGMVRLSGALTVEAGEVVTTALARLAEQAPADPDTGIHEPYVARCADALRDVCGAALADDADADRATVVIHVRADDLVDGDDDAVAETGSGLPISIEAVRRRCCDARYQRVKVDDCNRPVGIGRVSQIVPPSLRRLIRRRDRGCRFPGCGRTRFVQPHHIWWWTHGGPTDPDNLISLCSHHHHLVHEGGWRVLGNAETDDVHWIRPDGSALRTGPPPLHDEIRARIDQLRLAS